MKDGKIVVLAGNYTQFKYWLQHNIIPITTDADTYKLRDIKIKEIYTEGTYYESLSASALDKIHTVYRHGKSEA